MSERRSGILRRCWNFRSLVVFAALFVVTFGCGGTAGPPSGGGPPPPETPPPPQNGEYLFTTGTVTPLVGFRIDTSIGSLSVPTGVPGPVFSAGIAADPIGKFIYVADTSNNTVWGFSSVSGNGSLINQGGASIPGEPAALVVDPAGKFLYATSGLAPSAIDIFSIDKTFGFLLSVSLVPERLAQFRHVGIDPGGAFLYGIDVSVPGGGVYVYRIDSTTGLLASVSGSPFTTPGQPWDIAVHPTGRFLYTCMTKSEGVVGFSVDSATGQLTLIPGSPFPSDLFPGDITADPLGRFVYVHTTSGSVWGYTVDSTTGALKAVSGSPFAVGSSAGAIKVEDSGQFLYVGDGKSGNVYAFTIDPHTGIPTAIPGSPFPAQTPPSHMAIVNVP